MFKTMQSAFSQRCFSKNFYEDEFIEKTTPVFLLYGRKSCRTRENRSPIHKKMSVNPFFSQKQLFWKIERNATIELH